MALDGIVKALLHVNSFNRKVNKVRSLNIKVYKIARAGKCWNKVIISSPQWASVRPFKIGSSIWFPAIVTPKKIDVSHVSYTMIYYDLLLFSASLILL